VTKTPKLTYFDNPSSRGEECRLAFAVAGVEFEDNRIASSAWPSLKPNTPFGALPILEVEGKPAVSQTNAILAYVGRKYDLLPGDEWEALRLQSLMEAAEELRHTISKTFGIKDADELKRRRAELTEGPIRSWGASMERQIVGPFAAGDQISVADVKLFVVLGWLKKGALDHVPPDVLDHLPKLQALFEKVKNHPKVVAWYSQPR
jgi:glutathione S-transferase